MKNNEMQILKQRIQYLEEYVKYLNNRINLIDGKTPDPYIKPITTTATPMTITEPY